MLEILFWISAKKIVVAFALLGATVVTIAPKISKWAESKENLASNYKMLTTAKAFKYKRQAMDLLHGEAMKSFAVLK